MQNNIERNKYRKHFCVYGLFSLVTRSRNNLLLENSIVFEECALRSIFCRVSTRPGTFVR